MPALVTESVTSLLIAPLIGGAPAGQIAGIVSALCEASVGTKRTVSPGFAFTTIGSNAIIPAAPLFFMWTTYSFAAAGAAASAARAKMSGDRRIMRRYSNSGHFPEKRAHHGERAFGADPEPAFDQQATHRDPVAPPRHPDDARAAGDEAAHLAPEIGMRGGQVDQAGGAISGGQPPYCRQAQ